VLPAIKWTQRLSGYGLEGRLQNTVFGKLKGAALSEAFKVVRDNGGLVSGEDDSLKISDKDFEASS